MSRFSGWPTTKAADAVLDFWFAEARPWQWFRRNADFDAAINARFGALHRKAAAGRLNVWSVHPRHALALIIVLDQFSRNLFRDTPEAFAQDRNALNVARTAIRRRFDMIAPPLERAFFYMPFMHSESLSAQDECVALFKARKPQGDNLRFAIEHRGIIGRFGRFSHRNRILGRVSTPEEQSFLVSGGFNP